MTPSEKYTAAAYLVVFVGRARLRADHRLEAPAAAAPGRRDRRGAAREGGRARWLSCSSGRRCSATARRRIAYTSPRHTRLATWGVRIGWLAQTGLLVVPGRARRRLPVGSWAGSLNLFVWFTVGAYLIWGCQDRYRLVGLTVMPLAVVLFIASRIGGGTAGRREVALLEPLPDDPRRLRPRRVRRLHARRFPRLALPGRGAAAPAPRARHPALRLPSLVVLERLTVRTIAVSLPLLTVGLAAGIVRLREQGKGARRAHGRGDRRLARLRRLRRHCAPTGRRAA